jgi:hypothetical protein
LGKDNLVPFSLGKKATKSPSPQGQSLSLSGIQLEEVTQRFVFQPFCSWKKKYLREKSNLEPLVERGDYNHSIIFFPGKYYVREKIKMLIIV